MSHSKRNTSLAFFTSYERSLLKASWGSQATRLSRDSFLPFGSCQLCLQIAQDAVACAINGEIFCRECIVSNLLAQKKQVVRLERQWEQMHEALRQQAETRNAEEQARSVADFERISNGEDGRSLSRAGQNASSGSATGTKRTITAIVGDDEEANMKRRSEKSAIGSAIPRNVDEREINARKALDKAKGEAKLASFWVPSMTPSSTKLDVPDTPPKLKPLCPASSPQNKHSMSLKTLVTIQWKGAQMANDGSDSSSAASSKTCPACNKPLSNINKAVMAVPCGHVLCKPCAAKFLVPIDGSGYRDTCDAACYVCSISLVPARGAKQKASKKAQDSKTKTSKHEVQPGTVELKTDGTGFAISGDNMVQKTGTVFQC